MTEKRFTYDSKTVSLLKDGDFWLDGQVDTACNHKEICGELNGLSDENEQLKQPKPFLKIINDYYIKYGDEGELFSMHKPSDIRSLIYLLNRENGYSELQCEYNDLELI